MNKITVAVFGLLLLAGCQTTKDAQNLAALDVSFSWENTSRCSNTPPAFKILNVPAETKFLSFRLTDLNVPGYNHGGGTIAYSGSADISEGAFGYIGPCPPAGSHRYRFKVEALNAAKDMVLGRGEMTKAFPPN